MCIQEVSGAWSLLERVPVVLYAPEDLMPRATDVVIETGAIIYDALFLALAEETDTVMVTADNKLLRTLEGTPYAHRVRPLAEAGSLL